MTSGGSPPKPWDNGSGDYDALHSSMPTQTSTSTSNLPATTGVGENPGNYSNSYGSTYNGAYGNGYRNYGSGYSLGGSSYYRQPYGSSYSRGYGSLMGGGYGSFGGGYGGGYGGNYGAPTSPQQPGNFYVQAHQSAQPTFDSIMQVVDAFTAFTNLMDSTLMAVMTSFHSVLQVVDMFSKMPHLFAGSSLFRLLRFLWRRVVNFMLRRNSFQDTWDQNFSSQSSAKGGMKWPLMLFLAIVVGGPCFVYSLLDPNQDK